MANKGVTGDVRAATQVTAQLALAVHGHLQREELQIVKAELAEEAQVLLVSCTAQKEKRDVRKKDDKAHKCINTYK